MKRLVLSGVLGVALFLVGSSQAAAWDCHKCAYHGFIYSGGIYWELWSCETQGGFCSSCWRECRDLDGYGCIVGSPCEFAKIEGSSDGDKLASRPFTGTPAFPAP